jgi:hypothetical protein
MNCKPGISAYLSSDCVDEGRIVDVIRATAFQKSDLPAWICRSREPIDCQFKLSGRSANLTEFAVFDRHLRPISGVPVTDDVSVDLKIKEPV